MDKSIKSIIAIASGKGGVGKSTVTSNLACCLQLQGFKVGILDADIYGPSQALLFGINHNSYPQNSNQNYFVPIVSHNIKIMSLAFLLTENTPVIWRAPMATRALLQMLKQTNWGELDFLLIDLPPGTGDIALTLAQKANLTGAIIITTSHKLALLDAQKALEMFVKTKVPIIGIIENMSAHICQKCELLSPIFSSEGGQKMANLYQTPLLGNLPLLEQFSIDAELGIPTVLKDQTNLGSKIYLEISSKVSEISTKNWSNLSNNIPLINL